MPANSEILGLEYDWLASDADGHVALFRTAGGGYAPEAFLMDTDAHDKAIDAILASTASTTGRFAPELATALKNTWRLAAERGLFAFDSDANGGVYRLVAAPLVPMHVSQVPFVAATVLATLHLTRVRFAERSTVSEDQIRHVG